MPYPSPITYPSALLFPGSGVADGFGIKVAVGDLILNHVEDDGTAWTVNTDGLDGWEGSPSGTLQLTQRGRGHGATDSESFLTGRTVSVAGKVKAPAPELLSFLEDRLNAACSLDPFTLTVIERGRFRHVEARRQGEVIFKARPGDGTVADFSIQVAAKDSRKFGDLASYSTVLPFSTGGLAFPITFPVTWTGTSGTGTITINNPGNIEAPVWLRIDGPLPAGGHSVTHQGKKRTLTFGTTLALAAGEFLTVDMDMREVKAQGQSARSGYVTSRGWFSLDPGENVISFSSVNYSATASLTLSTKPAWS